MFKKRKNCIFIPSRRPPAQRKKSKFFARKKTKKASKPFTENIKIPGQSTFRQSVFYSILLLILCTAIFVVFFSNVFKVQNIEIAREDVYIDRNQVMTTLKKYFNKNIFTISTRDIKNEISEIFPIISLIKVSRKLPNRLKIDLTSYPAAANIKIIIDPHLLIKTDEESVASETTELVQKAMINSKGYIINLEKENLQLPTITLNDQKAPVNLYDQIITADHLDNILDAYKILKNNLHFDINKILYFWYGREMHFKAKKGFALWLDFEDTPSNQIDKLKRVISDFDLENAPPQYFDLRIKNRLIYK